MDHPPAHSAQVPHRYGTRKRQNSLIRPSVRLRDSPLPLLVQPRRIKPLGCVTPNGNTPAFLKVRHDKDPKEEKDKEGNRKHTLPHYVDFPPKHVVLHPDDANSKVFIAIGRALLSVNNCAMTVKDLAELTLKFGLVCQNASAAAQAITSFIRNHLNRCEVEQDFPLLLRHVLSGTPRDDSLVPALYSRAGGNVGKDKPKDPGGDKSGEQDGKADGRKQSITARLTSFRRGTMVWYLSKAAGAPCPFARCGIALRDYADVSASCVEVTRRMGSAGASKEGQEDSAICKSGLKRKREREGLRTQAASGIAVGNVRWEEEEEEEENVREGKRPTKVKLTLRLKPCLSTMREKLDESSSSDSSEDEDDSDAMSVDSNRRLQLSSPIYRLQPREHDKEWSLPPYPIQRRISIPPYTPCEELHPQYPAFQLPPPVQDYVSYRRSPSVPMSVASPPPDSEDEDDDFHISMTRSKVEREAGLEWEESTEETEGARSPERDGDGDNFFAPIIVKEEEEMGGLIRGVLDVWDVAGPANPMQVKAEPDDKDMMRRVFSLPNRTYGVKLEELDADSLPYDIASPDADWTHEEMWGVDSPGDVRLSVDLHIKQEESDEDHLGWQEDDAAPIVGPQAGGAGDVSTAEFVWKDVELLGPDSVLPQEFEEGEWEHVAADHGSLSSTLPFTPTLSSRPNPTATSKLSLLTMSRTTSMISAPRSPSTPSISSSPSLSCSARTWSSPETDRASLAPPSPLQPFTSISLFSRSHSVEGDESSEMALCGGPLSVDQSHVLDPFNHAFEHEAVRSPIPPLAERKPVVVDIPGGPGTPWERGMISHLDLDYHLLAVQTPLSLRMTPSPPVGGDAERVEVREEPLSPQEQEMFQSLCLCPDWEPELQSRAGTYAEKREEDGEDALPGKGKTTSRDLPLRRSKRVANALASQRMTRARPRTRAASS